MVITMRRLTHRLGCSLGPPDWPDYIIIILNELERYLRRPSLAIETINEDSFRASDKSNVLYC